MTSYIVMLMLRALLMIMLKALQRVPIDAGVAAKLIAKMYEKTSKVEQGSA
jgi:hypothetical protein